MNKITVVIIAGLAFGSCARQHLVKADKAYERLAFAEAARSYDKALARVTDREALLRAADAHANVNDLAGAAERFAQAKALAPLSMTDEMRYGQVLQSLGKHEQAAERFASILAQEPTDQRAHELMLSCEAHAAFYADSSLYTVTPITLSGMVSAFSATPYKDGIIFAGEKEGAPGQRNPWNDRPFLDLFSSTTTGGAWSTPKPIAGEVNGRYHEGPATFSADGRTMYFTRSDYYKFRLTKDGNAVSHLQLFRAESDDQGHWGNIHQFAYNGDEFSTGHATLSADGHTLYFISDAPGGAGGTDIYRSEWRNEAWSIPENVGSPINTAGNEMFPMLKGDSLFFSSNGHGNMGGLDIFLSVIRNGEWSVPENLNYPVNTPHDDFSFVLAADGRSGYLSSDRSGDDRVYAFTMHDPTLVLQGVFSDETTHSPMAGVEVTLIDVTTGEATTLLTGPDGSYMFPLAPGHDYKVKGGKDGMFTASREMTTKGQRTSRTYTEDFDLKAVVLDKPILVENIYYDYDRWDIRPEAALELDKLARLFKDNPNLSFELGSHTDSRASDLYNTVLSEARANSAVDYLIRSGVDPDRITARGHGERYLVNHCRNGVECTEEEHQANRRTEFKVTKVGGTAQAH